MFPIHPVRIAHGVWIAVLASVMLPVLLLAGCSREAAVPAAATAPPGVPVATDWPLPAPTGAAQPDLVRAPDGRLLLSWVEPAGERGHRLQLAATLAGETGWAPTLAVAEGEGWFVNWADTPRVQALADGSLWAHWLERTGPSRMDYGIALVRSDDGGRHWQRSAPVHPRGRGDHGFTTFWRAGDDRLGLAWLDSRQKAAAGETEGHDGHHGGAAAMMLRAAVHGPDGVQQAEWPLDASTCDCCTTASAQTARGVVVVYRGRGPGEIRDTRIVRLQPDGIWTAPRDVHRDGWHFPGCPVNGPAVAAEHQDVWVAWYTEADAVPELRLAHSRDAGGRFDPPVVLARGPQVLGRVALAQGGGQVHAAWLEEAGEGGQVLRLARYAPDLASPAVVQVATLHARGRASGLPRLQWADGAAWLAWTDVEAGAPVLRGAVVR
jgi:hypothetical protein